MTSREMVEKAVRVLDDKKAVDIQALDILKISTLGDYFVIASGNSTTHVKALVDELDRVFTEEGIEARNIEGKQSATWVLMDYLDVVIHIFSHETRDFYQLERLWGDAPNLDVAKMIAKDTTSSN